MRNHTGALSDWNSETLTPTLSQREREITGKKPVPGRVPSPRTSSLLGFQAFLAEESLKTKHNRVS
jgi:hypothetical protein